MGNKVFANGMEVSCKAAQGKSIAAFPDVCFTPPLTPATPPGVPIPYPNTGMASDTADGSRSVKISGKEVMLKNKSYFKRSMGDEAGSAPKKGVITSKNMGKVYFNAWSMDVKVEGENVTRMMDLTTHNHGSVPGNTPPWPYIDGIAISLDHPCVDDMKKEYEACKEYTPYGDKDPCFGMQEADKPSAFKGSKRETDLKPKADRMAHMAVCNDCINARRCALSPWESAKNADGDQVKPTCCPGQTPHHIVEKSCFLDDDGKSLFKDSGNYNPKLAPCVCAEGTGHSLGGTHELMHVFQKAATLDMIKSRPEEHIDMQAPGRTTAEKHKTVTYAEAKNTGLDAFMQVFPDAGCKRECIEAQLDSYHKQQCGIKDDAKLKACTVGPDTDKMDVKTAKKEIAMRSWNRNQLPASYRK